MGTMKPPAKCFFTGLPTKNIPVDEHHDRIDYEINCYENKISFTLYDYDWQNSKFAKDHQHIVKGLICNRHWPASNRFVSEQEFMDLINSLSFPKFPKEKMDNLFLEIYKLQEVDGEVFKHNHPIFEPTFSQKTYFKDEKEFSFYLRVLDQKGLLSVAFNSQSGIPMGARTTYEGLNYQMHLTETGDKSNKCFVAMSFDSKNKEIRNAIKTSLTDTGFVPILIDEQHIDAEKTINDEIIANIKKSKFCIADFTDQKDGVYFEAGYALGKGLKVIYTCQIGSFQKTHFDTNHFPHIIYETPSELKDQLTNKIEAWIKN